MQPEVQRWWEQALSDLKAAQHSVTSRDFDWACFQAQQAAEKALKAYYLKTFKELRKVHDLLLLARQLQLSPDLLPFCSKLTSVYVETRYPSGEKIPAKFFTLQDAQQAIHMAEAIFQWLKNKL